MMFPLVRDLAADGIPVAVTCRVLGFSKQIYFKWRANPVTDRDWNDAHLINAARDIHYDDPEFGYRFLADELAEQGVKASHNRVNRLCSQQKLWSVHARKRGTGRQPGPPVHDDLVRRIVGCSIDARMTADLAVKALNNAMALRGGTEVVKVIVHSDRGSQGGFDRSSQHLAAVRYGCRASRCPLVGGPEGAVLGQRGRRIVLRDHQGRTRRPAGLADPGRGARGDLRVDRGLMQPASSAFQPGPPESGGVGHDHRVRRTGAGPLVLAPTCSTG